MIDRNLRGENHPARAPYMALKSLWRMKPADHPSEDAFTQAFLQKISSIGEFIKIPDQCNVEAYIDAYSYPQKDDARGNTVQALGHFLKFRRQEDVRKKEEHDLSSYMKATATHAVTLLSSEDWHPKPRLNLPNESSFHTKVQKGKGKGGKGAHRRGDRYGGGHGGGGGGGGAERDHSLERYRPQGKEPHYHQNGGSREGWESHSGGNNQGKRPLQAQPYASAYHATESSTSQESEKNPFLRSGSLMGAADFLSPLPGPAAKKASR
jgi:hypothetical protein